MVSIDAIEYYNQKIFFVWNFEFCTETNIFWAFGNQDPDNVCGHVQFFVYSFDIMSSILLCMVFVCLFFFSRKEKNEISKKKIIIKI